VGPVFGILVAATVGSVVYLIASERQRARLRAWRATAERVGLEAVEESEGGIFRGASLTARSGALRVRMERYQHGKYDVGTRIVVGGLGHGPYGLSLRRESLATAIEKSLIGEREIELGASEFDRETRPLLTRLLRGQVGPGGEGEVQAALSDGVLTVEIRERLFSDPLEKLPSALAAALEVGRRLVAPGDTAARIAENVRDEPEASARLQGLLLLAREFPDHPATRERLLAARGDASAEVRLRTAMALGEEGRSTLVALVRDEGSSDAVAAKAVAALGDGIPVDLAEATLRRVAGTPESTGTTVACLDALGRLGRVEAEGLLIEALKSSEPQVRAAAARALGRAGTVAAVAALHEAMEARREISRSVGRQAIAEIQSRLSGAAPGQLSLSGAEAGALSLADGEPGRLSIAALEAELDSGDDAAAGSRARPAERE
jgi:HEAT repeat protein